MRAVRALIVPLVLELLGAGCGLAAESAGTHDGGASQGDAGVPCSVSITVSTTSPSPGSTIAAEATSLLGAGPFAYTWSVTDASGASVTAAPRTADGRQVDIPIAAPGSYRITVRQQTGTGYVCEAVTAVLAKNPTGKTDSVLFRFVPPPTSGLQIQQKVISVVGGTPQGELNFTLEQGVLVSLGLVDEVNGGVADAFVRLIANDRGFEARTYVEAGRVLEVVLLEDNYDVLVIPDETGTPRFAPTLVRNRALASLTAAQHLDLVPGIAVHGTIVDPGGAPLAGARVLLADGRLPSTLGVTDADGSFTVRAQAGGFGLSVAAPVSASMPDLELEAGITVGAVPDAITVAYTEEASPAGLLDVTVRSHGGAGPVAGARVTLRGHLPRAGIVTVGSVPHDAGGVVRRIATTDAVGRLVVPNLPAGDYELLVEPLGHGLTDDAVTRKVIALPGAATVMQLFPKVRLSGVLGRPADLGGRDLTGTRVTAILSGGGAAPALGAAPAAATDQLGSFDVRIDPADLAAPLEYLLVADPPPGSGLARGLQVLQVDQVSDVSITSLRLPRALLLGGTVLPEYGPALGGVYVEAYRYREPADADPAARAEAVTDAAGRFQLYFCDPDDM